MRFDKYEWTAISIMTFLFILVGFIQGWSVSLVILNMCIISAIMTMGVNISWGYAGVINFGVMGFAALGGLANIIISMPPTQNAWEAGGEIIIIGLLIFTLSIIFSIILFKKSNLNNRIKYLISFAFIISFHTKS